MISSACALCVYLQSCKTFIPSGGLAQSFSPPWWIKGGTSGCGLGNEGVVSGKYTFAKGALFARI